MIPMRDIMNTVRRLDESLDADPERQWFAGSKIFDDNGDPLIVHHFTYFEFSEFDRLWGAKYFKRNPEGIDTLGLWFTDNPNARYVSAEMGGRRMDCILRITKPFYLDDLEGTPNGSAWEQLAGMVKEAGGSTSLRDHLKAQGYDGIVLTGTVLDGVRQNVIVAFDPDQIRIVHNHLLKSLS